MHLRKRGRHALRRRRRREQEALRATILLEGAVHGDGAQVHEQAEVAAQSLYDHKHAGVQWLHAAKVVARSTVSLATPGRSWSGTDGVVQGAASLMPAGASLKGKYRHQRPAIRALPIPPGSILIVFRRGKV